MNSVTPTKRDSVPFRDSFQNFRRSPQTLLYGSPTPDLYTGVFTALETQLVVDLSRYASLT